MKGKVRHIIFLWVLSIFLAIPAAGQYYIVNKSDTSLLERDSIILSTEELSGEIRWQVSSDSITWVDIQEISSSAKIWIDSISSYRAISKEDNCRVISDTVQVGYFMEQVSNTFTISGKGKIYELPSDVQLIVPADAVDEEIGIEVLEYDSAAAKSVLPFPADSGKHFVFAVEFSTQCKELKRPITVRIPINDLAIGDLPRIYQLNDEEDEWFILDSPLLLNHESKYLEFKISTFEALRIQSYQGGLLLNNEAKGNLDKGNKSDNDYNAESTIDPCYSLIEIRSKHYDLEMIKSNSACYVIEEIGYVLFPRCPEKPAEFWHIREIGSSCVPQCDVMIDNSTDKELVRIDESFNLSFFTYIEGNKGVKFPLDNQYITFTVPPGISSVKNLGWTDPKGMLNYTLDTYEENLNGSINYKVEYNYCLELIEASGTNMFESKCEESTKKITREGTKRVVIYDECSLPHIDCSLSDDPACELIVSEILTSFSVFPDEVLLDINEKKPFAVLINDNYVSVSGSPGVSFTSSNPAIASVDVTEGDQWQLNAGSQAGQAIIVADLCGMTDTIFATVHNLLCDSAKVSVSPKSVKIPVESEFKINIDFEESYYGMTYVPVITFISNGAAAIVDDDGVITGMSKGNAEVVVAWCDTSVSINVEVTEPGFCDKANVEINTNPLYMNTGGQHKILVHHQESDPGYIYVPKISFSSADESIATVDSVGIVTAINEGEVDIQVSWCDKSESIPVTINNNYTFVYCSLNYTQKRSYVFSSGCYHFYNESINASYISRSTGINNPSERISESSTYFLYENASGTVTTYQAVNGFVLNVRRENENYAKLIFPPLVGGVHMVISIPGVGVSTYNLYMIWIDYFEIDLYSADGSNYSGSAARIWQLPTCNPWFPSVPTFQKGSASFVMKKSCQLDN